MDDEELLEKAKALDDVEELGDDERKVVERVLSFLRDEKKVSKKDRERIQEIYAETIGEKKDETGSDEDIDEDDFV